MRRSKFPIILSVLIFCSTLLYLGSFSNPKTASGIIKGTYHKNLDAFYSKVLSYQKTFNNFKSGKINRDDLKEATKNLRYAYKKVEYLAAHFDEEGINKTINGAPLKQLEPNAPGIFILEPEGLQILDEMVFLEEPIDTSYMATRVINLRNNAEKMVRYQKSNFVSDRIVIEAARFGLIRVISLSLTGFDAPGSLNSIVESKVVMNQMHEDIQKFYAPLKKYTDYNIKELDKLFTGSISFLEKNEDFDTFDRFTYLKEYINPLFSKILEIQTSLEIETVYETTSATQSTNFLAENIFDEDFLNPNYYMSVHKSVMNDKVKELGQVLFFDPILSRNNERSCASCHNPEKAFTDGQKKSIAIDFDGHVGRNAPTLVNSIFADKFFHDLRAPILENQIDHVVFNEKEFDSDFKEIYTKLNQSEEYKKLFIEAFPQFKSQPINRYAITTAIATYVKDLIALNSPFDQYVRGETEEIDESVIKGFNLFAGKAACATCHFIPTFNGSVPPKFHHSESEVLGVPADKEATALDQDGGRGETGVFKERAAIYKNSFKTVTVRNIALTGPYMHNGVYESLEEVMDFYNKGGGQGHGLDVPNQTLAGDALNLNKQEISDIISFMEALTDTVGTLDVPKKLPVLTKNSPLNKRKIGGTY